MDITETVATQIARTLRGKTADELEDCVTAFAGPTVGAGRSLVIFAIVVPETEARDVVEDIDAMVKDRFGDRIMETVTEDLLSPRRVN